MLTYSIRTFGCQMNVADSEIMAGLLEDAGYKPSIDQQSADVLIVNTCAIRRKAEDKAVSELGRLLNRKKHCRDHEMLVVAAGCVAKKRGEGLLKHLPGLDAIIGPSRIGALIRLLEERLRTGRAAVDVGDAPERETGAAAVRQDKVTAFVNIMHGCENHCAYCVVPRTRGGELSRSPEIIESEVGDLVGRGYGEVTLLGQNVNSYGKSLDRPMDFPDLLERLDRRTGVKRLRFTTSHPKDFSLRLAQAMRDLESVCEAIHLPVQSGADRVLTAMNRGYTSGEYLEKVSLLRRHVPEVSLSSDIIVGFPPEDEADFEATLDLIRAADFTSLFAFKYSPREGTPAADREDVVSPSEKDRRLQAVLRLQRQRTLAYHQSLVGRTVEVLVEGPSKQDPNVMAGRSRGNQVVNLPGGPELIGRPVAARLTAARPNCLLGTIV